MVLPQQIQALVNREIKLKEQHDTPAVLASCPRDNVPVLDGTGEHLQLRNPWYNDLSHEITDSTIFRLLLIVMVVDYVLKLLGD